MCEDFRGQSLEAPVQSPKRVLAIIDERSITSVREASHGLGDRVPGLFCLVLPCMHKLHQDYLLIPHEQVSRVVFLGSWRLISTMVTVISIGENSRTKGRWMRF